MTARELMHFLASTEWDVRRTVADARAGVSSAFVGSARLHSTRGDWHYAERGSIRYEERVIPTSREYIYRIIGPEVHVLFADGRPFYEFAERNLPRPRFEHRCGADDYLGEMSVHATGWAVAWRILGPDKRLRIESEFVPCFSPQFSGGPKRRFVQ